MEKGAAGREGVEGSNEHVLGVRRHGPVALGEAEREHGGVVGNVGDKVAGLGDDDVGSAGDGVVVLAQRLRVPL